MTKEAFQIFDESSTWDTAFRFSSYSLSLIEITTISAHKVFTLLFLHSLSNGFFINFIYIRLLSRGFCNF